LAISDGCPINRNNTMYFFMLLNSYITNYIYIFIYDTYIHIYIIIIITIIIITIIVIVIIIIIYETHLQKPWWTLEIKSHMTMTVTMFSIIGMGGRPFGAASASSAFGSAND
jgi:hypothetical protein